MLHPSFQRLAASPEYSGARTLMQRTYDQWASADAHFVRELQTKGFDARVFELYLAAALRSIGLTIGREGNRPDFRCSDSGHEFYVEAATAHLPDNPAPPATVEDYFAQFGLQTENEDEVAVRFGSVLRSKAGRRYEELPHVAGKPIVLAVQAFFGPGALLHSERPLLRYLYDLALTEVDDDGVVTPTHAAVGCHVGDTKTIPSGWFDGEESSYISAVLWSNTGTAAKFNRMAAGLGLGTPGWEIHRFGVELDPRPGMTEPARFVERVGPGRPEPWEEGLVLIHNPSAKFPLPESGLAGVTQIRRVGSDLSINSVGRRIYSQMSFFHPVSDRAKMLKRIHDILSSGHVPS
ncbi:hypothetical protein [Candidatus Poriferisodalis sp.]|uniref:hypothetical protein n=1 Tax=Candidatus Poriferisodalis sp. TaxID=3101277 RepID=UPI003B017126